MKQPLFSKIRKLKENGEDFAYFCRFSSLDRSQGEEFLFRTEERPFLFYDGARSALDDAVPQLIRESGNHGSQIPLFTSFSLVQETLGIRSRHERYWPLIGTILPSETETGTFTRKGEPYINRNLGQIELHDEERGKLEDSISEIVERIREGEALQIVLSHHFELEEFNGSDVLVHLLRNDRSRYVYYYKFGNLEIIGSSPENVFQKHGEMLSVSPIAGTRKRQTDTDENLVRSLLSDNKELCEHRMLVDLARNDLSRIGIAGSVAVTSNMMPEKFYSVVHLTSRVDARISPGNSNFQIFSSLFPAGTVSGAPKARAIEIIDQYESQERGPYGGAVGILGEGDMDMALAIRSAFMNRGRAYTQAGAGIVKDSVPRNEIEEIIAKAETIMAGGLTCA